MTATSEPLPGSATASAFSIKLKKNTTGPDVLLYEELELELIDGTQALHRHVTLPSLWGGGNIVYITDAKEGPPRSESSITDDSQATGTPTGTLSKTTKERQGCQFVTPFSRSLLYKYS
ncbi:hypothetical protein BKA70DRAFT_1437503 [Coprinopsis sp. MPI-PUGE-AT-0042]|nr:hypothetical protein BKA70DRAFT_1437503 [Coprinopsis sp. MPI-PUGE-AT-0042]